MHTTIGLTRNELKGFLKALSQSKILITARNQI